MEWIIFRVCDHGRVNKDHQQVLAKGVRGVVSIREERDLARHRVVRVASLVAAGGAAVDVPPLHDVTLLASQGGLWSVAGYERLLDGPLQDERAYAQSWLLKPAQDEDLQFMEGELIRLAKLLDAHGIDPAVRWSEYVLEKASRAHRR